MVAVKEAAGSVERVNAIKDACDIAVLSGDDSLTLPMLSVGASGVVSVASNIIPSEVSRMVKLALEGDFAGAKALHRRYYPLFRDLFIESNPIPIKAAMAAMGMIAEEYRLPMCEMTAAHKETLLATMRKVGLLA
jgi:4-hydroxy-tetrahydrodipicolinate synthase